MLIYSIANRQPHYRQQMGDKKQTKYIIIRIFWQRGKNFLLVCQLVGNVFKKVQTIRRRNFQEVSYVNVSELLNSKLTICSWEISKTRKKRSTNVGILDSLFWRKPDLKKLTEFINFVGRKMVSQRCVFNVNPSICLFILYFLNLLNTMPSIWWKNETSDTKYHIAFKKLDHTGRYPDDIFVSLILKSDSTAAKVCLHHDVWYRNNYSLFCFLFLSFIVSWDADYSKYFNSKCQNMCKPPIKGWKCWDKGKSPVPVFSFADKVSVILLKVTWYLFCVLI